MWTQFWDMHSGGRLKEKWHFIYIEAPQDEAEIIFYNRFGHNPSRVTCTCCGEDYSISEEKTLEQITGFHRGCAYDKNGYIEKAKNNYEGDRYQTLEEFVKRDDVLVIYAIEIKDKERVGSVPQQGYVWMD
jgi:hypothetical protein